MDSTILISKYLKEYNCLYKEANEIYHEAARRLHLSDSAFEIFYALFDMGDNCLQRDICIPLRYLLRYILPADTF